MAQTSVERAQDLDLEAEGLLGSSYDSFFKIDKRVHKIQDLHIPTRAGISVNQIITFIVVLFVALVIQIMVIGQILSIFDIKQPLALFLFTILAPPILCAWRVTRPMPFGKSIPGTVFSALTYYLDDETHRRGVPVAKNPRPVDDYVVHYQRDWTISREFADEFRGEGDWTDSDTERRLARASGRVDLQAWMDAKAVKHRDAEQATKRTKTTTEITVHNRRGHAANVHEF